MISTCAEIDPTGYRDVRESMPNTKSMSPYYGSGQLTREQFLFYEMRTTAGLMAEGLNEKEIINRIVSANLFQYPTERTIRTVASACVKRLQALQDDSLVEAIKSQPMEVSKQICLYAMMKRYRLVWDFMVTVIGEKYSQQNFSFSPVDVNTFFLQLQEQDDYVAGWTENTMKKIRSVLIHVLVENEYLDNNRSDHLNPVWLQPILENAIKTAGDDIALKAFNSFA